MKSISYLSETFARWSARWIPSSLAIAFLLTAFVYALGVTVAGRSFAECLNYWAEGFWVLLEFGMQMTVALMTGYMVASSPIISRALSRLAELPRGPKSTLVLLAVVVLGVNWIHWGMGIVVAIILVRFLVQKQRNVDYRVMVAVSYFGTCATWHAGISGSGPLLIASPGHLFEDQIGVIPMAQTVFTPFNLVLVVVVAAILIVLAPLLHPTADRDVVIVSGETLAKLVPHASSRGSAPRNPGARFPRLMDHHYAPNLLFGAAGLIWLANYLYNSGFALTLNTLNFGFFFLALVLHPSLNAFMTAAQDAVHLVHGIIIQFPLYAGIFGIIQGSGLATIIGDVFVAVASPRTLPLIIYHYSCVMNFLVPSGGSQFIVQAPYMISAGQALGVPMEELIIPFAWGDMTTNFLQPFWCIPLLTAADLEFKDILGYLLIGFATTFAVVSVSFYFLL